MKKERLIKTKPKKEIKKIVAFQSEIKIKLGTSIPAMAPPIGTPDCLIEKINARILFGVTSLRIAEDAGVIGP